MRTRAMAFGVVFLTVFMLGVAGSPPVRAATPASYTSNPTVGPMVEVNGTLGFYNAEVESAVDPVTGYVYDLWMWAYPYGGMGFARSRDGGHTWDPAFVVPGGQDFYDFTTGAYSLNWDPAIAVSSDGIVYVAFMHSDSASNPAGSPYVAVSFDHGASFAYTTPVIVPPKIAFGDRDFIAVAPDGTVYVTWNYAPVARFITLLCAPSGSCSYASGDFNVLITSSKDHGRTWSLPDDVSPGFPRGGALEGPLAVGSNGEIFVAFDSFPTAANFSLSPGHEYFTSSRDGGQTWSKPILLSGAYTCSLTTWWIETTLGLSSGGTAYVSFDVETPQGDVGFVRYSQDNGVTWSPLIRVTPDMDGAAHIMQVAPGDNGVAYLAWLTDNATDGSWSVYAATLDTSTNTVSAPVLVSPMPGSPFFWPGDTIGMAYLGGGAVSISWGSQVDQLFYQNDGIFDAVVQYT